MPVQKKGIKFEGNKHSIHRIIDFALQCTLPRAIRSQAPEGLLACLSIKLKADNKRSIKPPSIYDFFRFIAGHRHQ